jgi:ribonucleoside-diphosphate reductase alpha chain
MGLGLTGVANAIEAMGHRYGNQGFLECLDHVLEVLRDAAYGASIRLAREKGAFPLYRADRFRSGRFVQTLPDELQSLLAECGIRNSHLLSIAPTGTISFAADNISSGIEPVYAHRVLRHINSAEGVATVELSDYGVANLETHGRTVEECTVEDHLQVLAVATRYVDSAVSKTINVPADISWEDFKSVYMTAWRLGAKGCTTFRPGGQRPGVIVNAEENHLVGHPLNACELNGKGCE